MLPRFKDTSIRTKLIVMLMLSSVAVMLVMRVIFFTYEYVTFRRAIIQQLAMQGAIIAANSTAALAFGNKDDAVETLAALKAEPHLVAAGLYDRSGNLFAKYPARLPDTFFPARPGADGYRFAPARLAGFQPVTQGSRRFGTLYLELDTGAMITEWLRGTLELAGLVIMLALFAAYAIARVLQKQISRPILTLVGTVRTVAEHADYSIRAVKLGNDEVGLLTDAFNQMLDRIQRQNQTLRKNEVQLQTIIENLGEGLAVSDLNGQLLHFNRAALEMHGFATLAESRQHLSRFANIFELSTPEGTVLPVEQWPLARILRGEQLRDLAISIRSLRAGWTRIFAYGGTLVKDQDGEPMMAVVTISDITERRRAALEILKLNATLERRVNERTAQLEAANKELESFSYSVSHDLRAPLRHIDGFAGLLVKADGHLVSAPGRRYLAQITDSAKQMGMLIDDLLVFSRMARSELNITQVGLRQLVEETIQGLSPESSQRSIRWECKDLPVVPGDRPMLRQVFINLISNAVKYTRPRDPAVIEIGCQPGNNADEVVIYVRDNGVGFEMAYAHKLFGVFQRLHRSEDFEGTGIGLANVRRIITRHGGRTWAEGRPDAGATVYFSLPIKKGKTP